MALVDQRMTADAHRRGGMMSFLTRMFSNTGTGGSGSSGAANFHRNLAAAAGPGILGIGAKVATIGAGGAAALGALPAAVAPLLGGGVGLAGAGVAALGAKALIGSKQDPGQLYAPAQKALQQLTDMVKKAAQPLVAPLQQVFRQLPMLIQAVGPALKQMFAGAATLIQPFVRGITYLADSVLPLLGKAFRAAAPLLEPLLVGIGHLLTGLLPGVITLLKAAAPAVRVFAEILGTLGTDIGKMLQAFAPVLRQSAVIFKALADVISALFPIIGKLAAIFAQALAPVFQLFAGVIKSLLPFLVLLGRIIADFAKAVIKDLVSALSAVATLLIDLAPSFTILAHALGQVFQILENSGVFQILATALEKVAPALAKMVNALVRGLVPILPPLIKFLIQVVGVMAGGLAKAILAVLPPLTQLGLVVLQALVDLLPVLLPLFASLVGLLTPVFVRIIQDLATAFTAVITAIPPKVLEAIALGFLAIWAAIKIGGLIASVSNPVTLIALAVGLLIVGIVELVKHWGTVWGFVKRIAEDAWKFLTHGWGQYIILPLFAIRKAVEFVRDHWKQAWDDMKGAAVAVWHFIDNNIIHPLVNAFTKTLPNAFKTGVGIIKTAWHAVQDAVRVPAAWVVDHVVNGLINAYDWVASHVGAPQIPKNFHPFGLAAGGRIPGFGGGDILPALLEPGETVVSKDDSRHPVMRAAFSAVGVPGYQHGGAIGQHPIGAAQARTGLDPANFHGTTAGGGLLHKAADLAKILAALGTGNSVAAGNALGDMFGRGVGGAIGDYAKMLVNIPARLIRDAVHELMQFGGGGLGGKGGEIARYAMSFAGKIPYVWGGTAVPGGADCSGFVQSVYRHFGISAPRTSEAQGAWVKRGSPQTGGLALYNSPAGGPPPGHVAIVGFKGNVISQGGGMGPQIQPLRSMPLMFTGVPPGHGGLGNVGPGDLLGSERLWVSARGPGGGTAHIAGAIAMAESGGRSVKQQGQPPGLTGWGIWQITPTSGINQNGMFGNLLNASNNARAAVYLYRQAGSSFRPWATYNSGAYQSFMDSGGWLRQGASLIHNATGRPEAVLNPPQSDAFLALAEAARKGSQPDFGSDTLGRKLDRLIRAVEHSSALTGGAVADALNGVTRTATYRSLYSSGGA